jgi:hypothetical protein
MAFNHVRRIVRVDSMLRSECETDGMLMLSAVASAVTVPEFRT